ncbi:MAG: ISAs1 family transposase [Leptolyngbya foveolarum]|jgi:predicted transposase YbfD/YdcC|uniref:ISAs1 family transposase n=1 Tax=Leptolyngbya foveolarum TaxID=47253 RepID=A0A2W4TY85_9CYAN|nr:MAG: ISAs1 family transposase [Leptolyngbya foveolarum]
MQLAPKKTCQLIVDSGNHYLGALKGNQSNLLKDVETYFTAQSSHTDISQGHGRWEKRVVSICHCLDNIKSWPGLKTLIRVESERRFKIGGHDRCSTETRYYIASFAEPAATIADRIRGYWGVENKVHYVRDVTQGEDASRIRMHQLPQIFAVARNFALNIFRDDGFNNMAQAQRCCQFGLDTLKRLFRMK